MRRLRHEGQCRRRLHPRRGAAVSRPAGSEPGSSGLCRKNAEGGHRRADSGDVRRHDQGLGADERSGHGDVEADARSDGREEELTDTIFALSSGAPPAAIAVVRISGPRAGAALEALAGILPEPRRATVAVLRVDGEVLDNALVIRFEGPNSATGED